jgi:hypothetical protein
MQIKNSSATIILGLCSRGPYKLGRENILNRTVKWISWGYGEEYVHPEISQLLKTDSVRKGTKVILACWDLKNQRKADLLREATIDHISYRPGYVSFTLNLGEFLSGTIELGSKDHYLCRPVQPTELSKGV